MRYINKNSNPVSMNKIRIPIAITPDRAYLIGVFAGDGSIGYRKDKKEYSLKCVGNPLDEQEYYKEVISPRFAEAFGISPVMRHMDGGATFGFRIFSKSLILYLTEYIGLPLSPKYGSLVIPPLINSDDALLIPFLRGLFDTDGSISFKKRYRKYPYYPVISFSSKSESFTREVSECLKKFGFRVVEIYNYKMRDSRAKMGFTIINRLELNGRENLSKWLYKIGLDHPKNIKKLKKSER